MARIDQLLDVAAKRGASDLILTAGTPPMVRVNGELVKLSESTLGHEEVKALVYEVLNEQQRQKFETGLDFDFSYAVAAGTRFRSNLFNVTRGMGACFRLIPPKIMTIEELGMPPAVKRLSDNPRGLILVTGPTGSGKTTTLASVIDYINSTKPVHILTIEDPIEFVHKQKKAYITQREIGVHAESFASALRVASRENPDIILVGELRDYETMSLAISAAYFGLLVFGTLHTNSAPKTIDRIIGSFHPDQRDQVRCMLGDSLIGVLSQQLLGRADGKGRIAAVEVLIGSTALANIIREAKTSQIYSLIQAGTGIGMQTMDHALAKLVKDGLVTRESALEKAYDKEAFGQLMK